MDARPRPDLTRSLQDALEFAVRHSQNSNLPATTGTQAPANHAPPRPTQSPNPIPLPPSNDMDESGVHSMTIPGYLRPPSPFSNNLAINPLGIHIRPLMRSRSPVKIQQLQPFVPPNENQRSMADLLRDIGSNSDEDSNEQAPVIDLAGFGSSLVQPIQIPNIPSDEFLNALPPTKDTPFGRLPLLVDDHHGMRGLRHPLEAPTITEAEPKSRLATLEEATVRGLLTRDYIARCTRSWRRITPQEWQDLMEQTTSLRYGKFSSKIGNRPWWGKKTGDFLTVNREIHGWVHPYEQTVNSWKNGSITIPNVDPDDESPTLDIIGTEARAIQTLNQHFPQVTPLLQEFQGLLVAAGGAVTKSIGMEYMSTNINDVDLFFVDPDVENENIPDSTKIAKYNSLLARAIAFLGDLWLRGLDIPDETVTNPLVYILRNENVVTVKLDSQERCRKYQFILRVYPSVEAVLGGFDLGASMVAYDGNEIIATELGAWSTLAKTIIIDISRRSTSFEHRLVKYSKYFHLVFPGLANTSGIPEPRISKEDMVQALVDCVQQKEISRVQMWVLLERCADDNGYDLSLGDSDLEQILTPNTGWSRELDDKLTGLAGKHGYWLNAERFLEDDYDDENRTRRRRRDVCSLNILPQSLKLPRLEISLEDPVAWSDRFRVRLIKDPLIRYEFSTYQSSECEIICDGRAGNPPVVKSDYQDSTLWPTAAADANLAALLRKYPTGTESILVLHKIGTSLSYNGSLKRRLAMMADALQTCTVRIDFKQKDAKMSTLEKMAEIIENSFGEVNLGDVYGLFDSLVTEICKHSEGLSEYLTAALVKEAQSRSLLGKEERRIGHWWFRPEFLKLLEEGTVPALVKSQLEEQITLATSRLSNGPQWILRNPGRQWTASLNPLVGKPQDWYGEKYRSFRIGNRELETTIRLLRLRKGSGFDILTKDCFRLLLMRIIWVDSYPLTVPGPQLLSVD